MIDIRDVAGTLIVSVPVTEASEHVSELMVSDYVLVSYLSVTAATLPAGAYVIFNGVTYRLLKPYVPVRVNEVEYRYEPQFHSKIMSWTVRPFFFLQEELGIVIGRETDWTLTDNLPNFLTAIVKSLLDEFGETYTYSWDAGLTGTKSLTFQATSIFDALNEIAGAWETEWYLSGTVITFGKCAHGTAVTLTVGTEVSVPDITPANEGYYTRFYAFGSTRNIDQDYDSGSTTNHVVQKRLALPATTCPLGYKDIQAGLPAAQIFTKVLIFEDIYPSSNLAISAVRAELKFAFDGDGNKIQIGVDEFNEPIYERYSIFFFKIVGFTFTEAMIVAGKTLSVHFESGNLIGREFELGYISATAEYEIIFDESTGYIIPNEVLIPADGDTVILFNILMPQAYVDAAEAELEAAVNAEIAKQATDLNTYRVNSFPVRFTQLGISLTVGRNVTFVNGLNTLSTRVLSITEKLDFPAQKTIQIGEKKSHRTTQQLKEAVTNINKNVGVIEALNDLSVTIQNAYGRTQKQIAAALSEWRHMWYFDKSADTTPDQIDFETWIVRSNFDLFIDGNIQASSEITSWIAAAVQNEILANLTATAPLRKDTASNVRLDYDIDQFELAAGFLKIKAGVLAPSTHTHAIADVTGLQTALNNKLETSLKGAVSGLAELDINGLVPTSQLPAAASSLELGETIDTAYRGDRGKIAYDHSQMTGSNPHQTTFAQLVGLPTTLAGYGITDAMVSYIGTPANDQIAVFTGAGTIEGTTGLTFNGTTLSVTGDVNISAGNYYRVNTNMAIMQDGTMFKFGWLGLGTATRVYFTTISNGTAAIYTANTQRLAVPVTGEVQVLTSLQANMINEYTAAAGVTVDGVLIKDSQIGIAHLDNSIFEYVPNLGNPYLRLKLPVACDYEVQSWSDFSQFPSTIWESLPAASTTTLGGIMLGSGMSMFLREDGTWQTVPSGGSMVYPGAGIPVSTGTGWGTSITNNSTNWNLAYSHSEEAHQAIISGTGFVKVSGSTLSYDNSTYLTGITKAMIEAQLTGAITTHTHAYEPALGNPATTGYVLSSTSAGVRSWVAQSAGVTDHGALSGLADDDHSQYYNQARGDARYSPLVHTHSYQAADADLTSIAGLTGTTGLLRKTAADTWSLDTNTYLTSITKANVEAVLTGSITSHNHAGSYEPIIGKTTGYLRYTGTAWEFKDESYAAYSHTHSTYALTSHTQAESTISFTDITTGNATTLLHGYLPKLSGVNTTYLCGDGSWATPAGGGSIAHMNNTAAADVSIAVANTWYTGATLTLPIGAYIILGQITVLRSTTTAVTYSGRICNSGQTVNYASAGAYEPSVTNAIVTLTMVTKMYFAAQTTINLMATANQTATIKAALVTNAAGNTATQLTAIKIG